MRLCTGQNPMARSRSRWSLTTGADHETRRHCPLSSSRMTAIGVPPETTKSVMRCSSSFGRLPIYALSSPTSAIISSVDAAIVGPEMLFLYSKDIMHEDEKWKLTSKTVAKYAQVAVLAVMQQTLVPNFGRPSCAIVQYISDAT